MEQNKNKSRASRIQKSVAARARRKIVKNIKFYTELLKFSKLRSLRKKRNKMKKKLILPMYF
jgi:hypothetical protein